MRYGHLYYVGEIRLLSSYYLESRVWYRPILRRIGFDLPYTLRVGRGMYARTPYLRRRKKTGLVVAALIATCIRDGAIECEVV